MIWGLLYFVVAAVVVVIGSALNRRKAWNDEMGVCIVAAFWPIALVLVPFYGLALLGSWLGTPKPRPVRCGTACGRAPHVVGTLSNGVRVDVKLVVPSLGSFRKTCKLSVSGLRVVGDSALVQDDKTSVRVEEI